MNRDFAAALPDDVSAQPRSRAAWCGAAFLASLLLAGPALWNRFPLLQYDTGGYLARWFEGYLVPSRPGAYGLLLAAAAPADFWPVIVVQAAVTVWILSLLLRELGLDGRPAVLLGMIAALSATTTLPWLTSILLTDIFAGLAVLALYLLVFGETAGRWQRVGLLLLIAFAAATHSATLALVAGLTVCALLVALWKRRLVPPARAGRAGAALLLGIALTLGANALVSGRFVFTPGGYGILFGRMLQTGIVSRYLHDHCPDQNLKLCPYRNALPSDADDFLWGGSLFDRLGRFAGLGDEMRAIALGSLHDYPLLQLRTALAGIFSQLGKVASGEGVVDSMWHTYAIVGRYTPAAVSAMSSARQQHGELGFAALNRVHVPVALISAALLPLLLIAGRKWAELDRLPMLAATILLALMGNAFVCGALANPHDRYGARLIWLAPLTVFLVPVLLRRRRMDAGLAPLRTPGIGPSAGSPAPAD